MQRALTLYMDSAVFVMLDILEIYVPIVSLILKNLNLFNNFYLYYTQISDVMLLDNLVVKMAEFVIMKYANVQLVIVEILALTVSYFSKQNYKKIVSKVIGGCLLTPCQNSGTCHNSGICLCAPGFTGTDCSYDINECTSFTNVCQMSSVCINTVGSYFCNCSIGFAYNQVKPIKQKCFIKFILLF